MMKKLFVCFAALACACAISAQVQRRDNFLKLADAPRDAHGLAFCGTTSDWIWEINQQARRALASPPRKQGEPRAAAGGPGTTVILPKPAAVFTPQTSFPVAKVITCGKFRLYYEDLLQANNHGFAHPTLGAKRRNTLCAVLNYVQSVYNFNQLPANDYIDIYVSWSYAGSTTTAPPNPAPGGTAFLAQAGPILGGGYGTTPGFYGGNVFDHVTTSVDPQPGQYDGVLQVNFDTVYSGSFFQSVLYWNDYTDTTSTCALDLYTILLHEVTHMMGWFSNVKEDPTTHQAQNTLNNSFSLIDKYFLYYGDAKTPSTFTGKKLVTISPPAVNAAVNSNADPLRSNKIWMNSSGIPLNHPAYSGDFLNYYSTAVQPFAPESLLSHLNDNFNSFTGMAQFSPGFQPNYVMGPGIATEQLKRQWTNFELRALLTIGYQLNPAFAASTSLSLNNSTTNQNLLSNNIPPRRSTPVQVTVIAAWDMTTMPWAETIPVTTTIAVNNNLTLNGPSQAIINVSSLGADDNFGDTVRVLPNSLFNIRGTGSSVPVFGGNNHNQLSVNAAGTQVTFTPRPGFRGRAQFGFYLSDGKEKGSFVVATVNVLSVGAAYLGTLPFGFNKIMNGSFEEGTEVRQRLLNEGIEHTGWEFYREGPFMSGDQLSDNQPSYNIHSNNASYNGGEYVYQAWKECDQINGGVKGNYGRPWSDFNSNGYKWTSSSPVHPLGNAATTPNHRYHNFGFHINFFELLTPAQKCHRYRYEMDINFQRTGWAVGSNFAANLELVTNPGTTATATVLQTVPLNIPVTTVAPNAWQHFSTDLSFCSATPATFINLTAGSAGYPVNLPLIDNLSLSEIVAPPLTVSASASLSCCATLSATAANTSCTTTYTWQPGNLSGANVTVCPSVTTTYTVTVNDGCQTATASVTVPPLQSVGSTAWPKHPAGQSDEYFTATARAANDDLFAAGHFTDDVTISGFPTWTSSGVPELMVARFSENCGALWAVQLGHSAGTIVNDMVVDGSGNVFITGSVGMKTKFGSFVVNGPAMYIVKLDGNNGNVLAAKGSSISKSADGVSLSLDAAGNVYVGGQFSGTLNFAPLPGMSSTSSKRDVFAVKYNNALAPIWSTSFGSSADDYNGGIAYSSTGLLYVAGNMNEKFILGSTVFPNAAANTTDMFIGRFNPANGAFLSGRIEGNNTGSCIARDIAVDGAGNVYFTGTFQGQFNVTGSGGLNANPTGDIFIGRWTPGLSNSWAYWLGGGLGPDEGRSISFDNAGNVYFSGHFFGTGVFALFSTPLMPGMLVSNGIDMFVVQLTLAGVKGFAAQSTVGSSVKATNYSITTLPNGQSYVAGSFTGTITFGTSATQTAIATDAIIGRLKNTGSFY